MSKLNQAQVEEKNRLESGNILLEFLEISYGSDMIRIVKDNVPHTWREQYWEKFDFQVNGIEGSIEGDSTIGSVAFPNVDRFLGRYFDEEDGLDGAKVTYRGAFSSQLEDSSPLFEYEFSVVSTDDDEVYAILNLGHGFAINARRPERIHLASTCDFQYGSLQCGVSNSMKAKYPTCSRNLKDCRTRGNSIRFGGEPAIPIGGAYVT